MDFLAMRHIQKILLFEDFAGNTLCFLNRNVIFFLGLSAYRKRSLYLRREMFMPPLLENANRKMLQPLNAFIGATLIKPINFWLVPTCTVACGVPDHWE